MPNLPHLTLPKAEYDLPRKKHGFGSVPDRDYKKHGTEVEREVEDTLEQFRNSKRPKEINPSLILRITLDGDSLVDEVEWARNNMHLLSVDDDKSLVLFSSDAELGAFKERLDKYKEGPPEGQKSAPHTSLFSAINHVSAIMPEDRIGRLLNLNNITSLEHFRDEETYCLDVELWPIEKRDHLDLQIQEISEYVNNNGGEVSDVYAGVHLVLMRVIASGNVIRDLLNVESVESLDLPPKTDIVMQDILNLALGDYADVPNPPENASSIAIFDSGITSAHPFLATAVGEATAVPNDLGDGADVYGHGTRVAGIALYNDVNECASKGVFEPKLKIYSAKVITDTGAFSDKKLIMSQMTDAISYFNGAYNCRVFNISLGDKRLIYDGGKIGGWATVLDSLARELDVVIIVSSGNYSFKHEKGSAPDSVAKLYPEYLLGEDARINEPATGAIVVTVGSICESEAVPKDGMFGPELLPIANQNEPSPFTRRGPGCGGSIKPEFCDFGGNLAFDGALQKTRDDISELSSLTLNHNYLKDLLTTSVGTSYAAPRVAHKAAILFNFYPQATSNLIRAFLAASARVPEGSTKRLSEFGVEAELNLLGYGQPNVDLATLSDMNRVILYSEDALAHDNFHIFEVPIVNDFIQTKGKRSITVTLAFDPPVRHTRIDYIGVKMSFRLIRGKSVADVAEAFRKMEKGEGKVDSFSGTKYNCSMKPGPSLREGGTLQKAKFTMARNPDEYGEAYYIVVRCEKKWASEEDGLQKYSIVVQIEHEAEIDIYADIQHRIQPPLRVRV